ncbi:MAG TPA: hypothetical protein VKY33_00610 [Flavobacterium sp.]|nr:hypothetical protein [Flavobacterium sp.]
MRKFLFALIVYFISFLSHSQITEETILKDPDFKILEAAAIAFYTSEANINYVNISQELFDKVDESFIMQLNEKAMEPENFKIWIEKNLEKTNFNSLEDALIAHKQYYNSFLIKQDEQKTLFSLLSKLREKYGADIDDTDITNSDIVMDTFTKYTLNKVYDVLVEKKLLK